jgi:hypothetical protein
MANRIIVTDLFETIAAQIGFKILLGNGNLCYIKLKSTGEEFIVEFSSNNQIYHIYPVIGDIPFDDRKPLFDFLMKPDVDGIKTG